MNTVRGNFDLRHAFLCAVNCVTEFSPAKINLFLAITGRRADGFHDLVSVAAPLRFGDELSVTVSSSAEGVDVNRAAFSLECDDATVPVDGTNLILRAAEAFAKKTGWRGRAHFALTKKIPMGAGLGGGSSNAVAALRALNRLVPVPLTESELEEIAASLGSDCVLFLRNAPVLMRGRGERVELLPATASARLRGRRVLVFKPNFGISTPWAYGRMVARGTDYLPAVAAEARLAEWVQSDQPVEKFVFNNMEPAAFEKYLALPVLLERLRREFGVVAQMSGSGSACYALLSDDFAAEALMAGVRASWGDAIFMQETWLG
jgi:4-diphosphocytidyl-2-C-methyl-D-erythritol kinase